MEKQYNVNIKDYLIKLVSEQTGIHKNICDSVIMWAYKDARDATSDNISIEFSGFGTLNVSRTKCERRIAKLEPMKERIKKRMESSDNPTWEKKYLSVSAKLDDTKIKLNRIYETKLEGNKRGVDQPPISEGGNEGTNREDIQGEAGNLPGLPL